MSAVAAADDDGVRVEHSRVVDPKEEWCEARLYVNEHRALVAGGSTPAEAEAAVRAEWARRQAEDDLPGIVIEDDGEAD